MGEWHAVEEFDKSWPYRFKWGYSAQKDRAHGWRIPDQDGDGLMTHREEFAQTFGHKPVVRTGDQLGLASYVPEERMYDGSIAAPPEIQIHTYYGGQPHDRVYEWFLNKFPDVIVRKARAMPHTANPVTTIHWTWDPPDLIIGHKVHGGKMWTGEAKIQGDTIVIDADRPDTPQEGIGKLKAQLASQYPNAEFKFPSFGPSADPKPSFLEREQIEQRHEAALQWANTFLPQDYQPTIPRPPVGRPPKPGFFSRFKRKANDGADMQGAMVAVFIPADVAKKIKVRGGEPVDQMHITLAYFTDKAADRDDWDEVRKIVETIANQTAPMTGEVGGVGVFQNDDGDVLWASPSVPGLVELRQKIVEAVEDAGFNVSDEHGWVPHITLKYNHKGKLPRVDAVLELKVENVSFAQGEKHDDFKLDGEFVKTTSWEMTEWSWPGTHRFVTDGSDILLEPEDQAEWQPSSLDGLQDKFNRIYPESTKSVASGWAIPTADGEGYGIWSPKVGYGGNKELGLHDLITKLDKELKKPTHLVEEWDHIIDPKMYASTHKD